MSIKDFATKLIGTSLVILTACLELYSPRSVSFLMEQRFWGYTMATPSCADCRSTGGTLTKLLSGLEIIFTPPIRNERLFPVKKSIS